MSKNSCSICEYRYSCKNQCMEIPGGYKCCNCCHYKKCSSIFGVKAENTHCDFYPIRFVLTERSET